MPEYTESFSIVNNSPYNLNLDTTGSQNLGGAPWPATVPAGTTTPSFTQTGRTNVNPTAVYQCEGANPPINIYMHFYCWSFDPALHVNMTLTFSNSAPFPGSCIAETNSHSPQNVCTPQALSITTTDDGSSTGNATFTIGNPSVST